MEDVMLQLIVVASVIAPIVTAVLEVIKRAVNLPKNYMPLFAVITGIGIGYLASISFTLEAPTAYLLWAGALAGLASVGLFEIGNKRFGGTKDV